MCGSLERRRPRASRAVGGLRLGEVAGPQPRVPDPLASPACRWIAGRALLPRRTSAPPSVR
eukprot:9501979-Pyramimonas_sp.AAC.1